MKQNRSRRRLEATAYHEAGHAVIAAELRVPFRRVSIVPDDDSLGHVLFGGGGRRGGRRNERDHLEARIMITLAGGLAEARFTGRLDRIGANRDRDGVVNLALLFCGPGAEATAFVRWLHLRTDGMLRRPATWAKVEGLARALLERPRIGSTDARRVMRAVVAEAIARRSAPATSAA